MQVSYEYFCSFQTCRFLMNIFALPQCRKQQWGQNFLYCTAGAIFFPPAFSANFLTVLQAPTISTKDKDSEREKASNQEDGLSIRSPIRFWEHTIYKTPQEVLEGINLLSCVLNAEINITRGGNDKCWIKRCTGKVLRDFRGERIFFFSFLAEFKTWATEIEDKHYKPEGNSCD